MNGPVTRGRDSSQSVTPFHIHPPCRDLPEVSPEIHEPSLTLTSPPTRLTHAAPYIRRVTRKKKRERDAWVDRTGYERQAARTVLTGSFTRFISFTNIPS